MDTLKKSILLTGLKHCGKSSTGKIAAESLSCIFNDIDDLAEEIFFRENSESLSSREIYRRSRELFQSFELKAARKLTSGKTPVIAAAGGGICDNGKAVNLLKRSFIFVYIEEKADILFERIIKGGIPAFLSNEDPFGDFSRLYRTRSEKYDRICNIKITASGRTTAEISREMVLRLKENNYAG